MRIQIQNQQDDVEITRQLKGYIKKGIRAALKEEGFTRGDVSVLLCDEQTIHTLNRDFRNVDAPTDVLSFPNETEGRRPHIGDMAVYMVRAKDQGEEFGHGILRETAYLCAHSALHLVGYDHMTEEERAVMREKEEKAMTAIGLPRE
ncbi:MAG: rRNA maturation RNase YbeY [Clostridia bacterium]|nr:rRNA maturation RNase YbeY [Clostridia bacterium]